MNSTNRPNGPAFIAHLKGMDTVANIPGFQNYDITNEEEIKKILRFTPPQVFKIYGKTPSGVSVDGRFILIPYTAEMMLTEPRPIVLERIQLAIDMACAAGCNIAGLGAITGSAVTGSGSLLERRVQIPLTSGNTFAAVSTILTVEKAAQLAGINLSDAHVAVIGATGSVGGAISMDMSSKVRSMTLCSQTPGKLTRLASQLKCPSDSTVSIKDACKADIIIVTTAASGCLITKEIVKPGTLIIDETQPRNTSPLVNKVDGVQEVDGGFIAAPDIFCELDADCPIGAWYGCFVETIMLSLENDFSQWIDRTSPYCGRVETENFAKIISLAEKYGFELAPLYSFDHLISNDQFRKFRDYLGK
jgi:predicted amino acid dehydrogenase